MDHNFGIGQPWWGGFRRDVNEARRTPIPQDLLGGGFKTITDVSIGGSDNANVSKEMQVSSVSLSEGKCEHDQQYQLHASSVMPQIVSEFVYPPTQMELVGHSIACAPYPYSVPYHGGLVPAREGPSSLAHSQSHGPQRNRMVLPLEMAEEPVYVNAKQYRGIMRRRQIRAKDELKRKVIKTRNPYLHESRHRHAMRRARGPGGRFLNTKKLENAGDNNTLDKGPSGLTVTDISGSHNCIVSEFLPSKCYGSIDPSTTQQEAYQTALHNMFQNPAYMNDKGDNNNLHHHNFQASAYNSLSDDREGRDSSRQLHERVVNKSLHRALTIK